jgi:hypothetical protein
MVGGAFGNGDIHLCIVYLDITTGKYENLFTVTPAGAEKHQGD